MKLRRVGGLLAIVLGIATTAEAESNPAGGFAALKTEAEIVRDEVGRGRPPGTSDIAWEQRLDRCRKKAACLAHRALDLAELDPNAPEAVVALVWIHRRGPGGYGAKTDAECDAAYDMLAKRYLDQDALLPLVKTAWADAYHTAHAERFLRAALEHSPNVKVRAVACFTLGRHQQELAGAARELDHPVRGEILREFLGPEKVQRISAVNPQELMREAEALYERTLSEFADLRPIGGEFPPLCQQAEGALFQVRNLEIGCTVPEIEGEDIDGKPLKLSDYRGKAVVLAFWETGCKPCMDMVPREKDLIERNKGRPFVLLGVNGDNERDQAKATSARERMSWRSFWDGARAEGVAVHWSIRGWPTVYLIDGKGVIRDKQLGGYPFEHAVDTLVTEAEAATGKP